jgi:hypothetical protein
MHHGARARRPVYILDVNVGQNDGQIRSHDSHDQPVTHSKTVVARFRKLFIKT